MVSEHSQAGAESFYALTGINLTNAHCQGTACFVARCLNPERWQPARAERPRVHCLGKCYAAPAHGHDDARPNIQVFSKVPVVLERIVAGGAHRWEDYQRLGGGVALRVALSQTPERVIRQVEASQLRGRGGAGFPTGTKWRIAAKSSSPERFVVANVDEGDPGAFIDRFISEDDPFALIEGLAIAAYAVSAARGWFYVRTEYPDAIRSLSRAIDEARVATLIGPSVFGTPFKFELELVVGRGSYVCGEETALLNSIEGHRPVVRLRPPYVAERGLWEKPTVVNNAESLANIPWIVRHGGDRFASLGIPGSRGTKVLSLNSLFRRPGLYEVDFGISLHDLAYRIGGGLKAGDLRGLMVGGPLSGVLHPSQLSTPLGFDELEALGCSVGHGGVIAFNEHTSVAELICHVLAFASYESCGNCTPCRLGPARCLEIFTRIVAGEIGTAGEKAEWNAIVKALKYASLCGLGAGLADFAQSMQRMYAKDLQQCFR